MNEANEKGNVLWFILIGIVLLGILTGILSRGSSSVDQSGNIEQIRIKAGQIMRFAKGIESAVQDMQLRGISENEISFENGTTAVDYTNANCDAAADQQYPDCQIFHAKGAGLTYRDPPTGTNDGSEWIFTSANNVGTAAGPVGTTAAITGNDLIMLMPGANASLCIQINRELGVGTAGTIPIETTGIATTAFTGGYPGGGPSILDGDPAPFELDNENMGCFTDTNAAPNVTYFYYVILAR